MTFAWTERAIEALKTTLLDGKSYGLAANEVSEATGQPISRNACIGKAKRLGLSVPLGVSRTRKEAGLSRRRRKQFNFNPYSVETERAPGLVDLPIEESDCAIPLIETRDGQCRWPLGEPSAHMLVCAAVCGDRVYCDRHHEIANPPRRTN